MDEPFLGFRQKRLQLDALSFSSLDIVDRHQRNAIFDPIHSSACHLSTHGSYGCIRSRPRETVGRNPMKQSSQESNCTLICSLSEVLFTYARALCCVRAFQVRCSGNCCGCHSFGHCCPHCCRIRVPRSINSVMPRETILFGAPCAS